MNGILRIIKQSFCRHEWRPTLFQALVGERTVECTKCRKMEHQK